MGKDSENRRNDEVSVSPIDHILVQAALASLHSMSREMNPVSLYLAFASVKDDVPEGVSKEAWEVAVRKIIRASANSNKGSFFASNYDWTMDPETGKPSA